MKYIWEPDDIECGLILCKSHTAQRQTLDGWDAKHTYMIGYLAGEPSGARLDINGKERKRDNFILIALCDGMTTGIKTRDDICRWATESEMMKMPKEKFKQIITILD